MTCVKCSPPGGLRDFLDLYDLRAAPQGGLLNGNPHDLEEEVGLLWKRPQRLHAHRQVGLVQDARHRLIVQAELPAKPLQLLQEPHCPACLPGSNRLGGCGEQGPKANTPYSALDEQTWPSIHRIVHTSRCHTAR